MSKFKPFKAKAFAAPTKKKEDGSSDCITDDEEAKRIKQMKDLETYEVMYTKHVNQKLKTWEEGLFVYNTKNFKAQLYNDV